jgi:HSP20 family molecular chaperone IbpA
MSFFEDFEREWNRFFKLSFSNFNRPVKDMQPYKLMKSEKGYAVILNTLGIAREDLEVKVAHNKGEPFPTLFVKGKTLMGKLNFENTVDLAIRLNTDERIEDVMYEVKDGLTIVYLKLEEKEPKIKIEAKYIDDDFDF